jgi:hypothetical protein
MDVLFCMLLYLKQRPCDELITHPRSPALCMCVTNKCLIKIVTTVTLGGGGGVPVKIYCFCQQCLPVIDNKVNSLVLIQYFGSCCAKEVEVFKGLFPW